MIKEIKKIKNFEALFEEINQFSFKPELCDVLDLGSKAMAHFHEEVIKNMELIQTQGLSRSLAFQWAGYALSYFEHKIDLRITPLSLHKFTFLLEETMKTAPSFVCLYQKNYLHLAEKEHLGDALGQTTTPAQPGHYKL